MRALHQMLDEIREQTHEVYIWMPHEFKTRPLDDTTRLKLSEK
jgi:hypothetical protein